MAENISNGNPFPFRPRDWSGNQRTRRQFLSPKPTMNLSVVSSPGHEFTPAILTPRSPNPRNKGLGVGDRSHTMFISKSPAENFVLPREPTSIAKQSMTLVDLNQLRSGTLFDNNEDLLHSQGNSSCSSRLDMPTPLGDFDVHEVLGQKSPERGRQQAGHFSAPDTPSGANHQMRTQEMLGSSMGMNMSDAASMYSSPAPGFSRYGENRQDIKLQFLRSRGVYGQMGRGANKYYRKPGLPGASARSNQAQPTSRQNTFVGSVQGNTTVHGPAGHTGQKDSQGLSHYIPSFLPSDLSSVSPRVLGVYPQPEPRFAQLAGHHDVIKRRAVHPGTASWRTRANSTLGNGLSREPTLAPDLSLNGRQPAISTSKTHSAQNGILFSHPSSYTASSARDIRTLTAVSAKLGDLASFHVKDSHRESPISNVFNNNGADIRPVRQVSQVRANTELQINLRKKH